MEALWTALTTLQLTFSLATCQPAGDASAVVHVGFRRKDTNTVDVCEKVSAAII